MDFNMPIGLSKEPFEEILKKLEKNNIISINDINVTAATKNGDNYSSDVYRVNIKYSKNDKNKEITEKRSFIAKVGLTSNGKHSELFDGAHVFDTEIKMMTSTLKEMQMLLNDVKLGAKFYHARQKNPSLIIIEDLGGLGFRMSPRQNGLDLDHCLLVMKGLAKFHASSVAVLEKNPKYKLEYKDGIYYDDAPFAIKFVMNSTIECFGRFLKSWPEFSEMWAEKMIKFSENAYEILKILRQPDQSEFNVIAHGDCWTNNMLFAYNCENKPVAHTFVDFQCCFYSSPAVDIQYFLNSSPTEHVSINHRDTLIKEYHQTLCETMKKLNCKTKSPTLNDLYKYMKKYELFGLMTASQSLPLILQKNNEAGNFDELLSETGCPVTIKMYNTIEYKKAISWRLHYWNQIGLLDNYS